MEVGHVPYPGNVIPTALLVPIRDVRLAYTEIGKMSTEPAKDTESPATAPSVPGGDESISEADAAAIAAAMVDDGDGTAGAKSLKCVDCGKLFKNADLANYHAEKSGHENFEESTEEVTSRNIAISPKYPFPAIPVRVSL